MHTFTDMLFKDSGELESEGWREEGRERERGNKAERETSKLIAPHEEQEKKIHEYYSCSESRLLSVQFHINLI